MCGILFSLSKGALADGPPSEACQCALDELFPKLLEATAARGPDAQGQIRRLFGTFQVAFCASELRLRGDVSITQPHIDQDDNILCWNGEIFEGLDIGPQENDGAVLLSHLRKCSDSDEVSRVFGNIEGPYAFLFYHRASNRLYFGRDPLGRRSLLVHYPTEDSPYFLLASVSAGLNPGYEFEELSTQHIYTIEIDKLTSSDKEGITSTLNCITRTHGSLQIQDLSAFISQVPRVRDNESLPFAKPTTVNRSITDHSVQPESLDKIPPHLTTAVDELIAQLDRSVMLRVRNIPRRDTFTGEARVAVFFSGGIDSTMIAFLADRHVAPEEPIDLLNVAFENPRKIAVKVEGNIYGLPKREKKAKLRDPLDYSTVKVTYDVPDRLTGLQEVEELRRLCPKRTWNFLEVNVPYEESQKARSAVEALMFPSRTVMDLSLAIALYFAARGVGQIRSHPGAEARPYTSPARVLLNGLGSDELLGGYGRHRTAYKAAGWQAVIDELQLEIDRIPTRNLGRDDRVISSWGKETRHPFLSLSVVNFLAQLPVHMKMDPRMEAGIGEKLLLRLAAHKLGLVEASQRKKRAMQFGSHSARMGPGEGDRKGDLMIEDR